mmetsp:Transcript_11931/g.17872  ORF Transcript_11931/g.17872 Transcript_11931/m.17872 type:complete len:217 (+) Transcript_11931:13-663(+)
MNEFDPSLRGINGGQGQLVASHMIRLRMRVPSGSEEEEFHCKYVDTSNELLLCKIISFYDNKNLRISKLEILSETDVFFYYFREMNRAEFRLLKEEQQLNVDFDDFPLLLADLAGRGMEADEQIQCTLTLIDASRARLDFISVAHAFRHTELLSIELDAADIEQRDLLISFRYNELRRRLAITEDRYRDLATAVRQRYPHILRTANTNAEEQETSS